MKSSAQLAGVRLPSVKPSDGWGSVEQKRSTPRSSAATVR